MERNRPVGGLIVAMLVVPALMGCGGGGSGEPTLTLFAASSLTEALGKYDDSFPGARVRSSFAGSGQLAAQLGQGAKADVFASADTGYPAELHRAGVVGRPVVFARNRLVVVTAEGATLKSLR